VDVLWIIWITPQVTNELHQHERAVEFIRCQRGILGNHSQRSPACDAVSGIAICTKRSDSCTAIANRRRYARVQEKLVDKLRRRHRSGKCRRKARALREPGSKSLLVVFQDRLPTGLAHHHSLANFLRVGQKLPEADNRYRELMRAAND